MLACSTASVSAIGCVARASAAVSVAPLRHSVSDGLGPAVAYSGIPIGGTNTAVSCTSATNCTAVGGDASGMTYATEAAGSWGRTTEIPTGAGWPYGGELDAVSCSSSNACTAVGSEGAGGVYVQESSGVWGAPTGLSGRASLLGVSCSDASDCTAVGADGLTGEPIYVTESAGKWGPVTDLSPSFGGTLTGVSCTDAIDCTAVGLAYTGSYDSNGVREADPAYVTESAGTWGAVTALAVPATSGQFTGVSCSSSNSCTAVGYEFVGAAYGSIGKAQPIYSTESAGSWGAVMALTAPSGNGALFGVSCSGASCTAVGQDSASRSIYVTESSGHWGTTTELSSPDGGALNGVACLAATDCTAVGGTSTVGGRYSLAQDQGSGMPIYAAESAGTWGSATELSTSGGGSGWFSGISCADPTHCTAIGSSDSLGPFIATEVSGTWGQASHLGAFQAVNGISCTGATDCTVVGSAQGGPASATETAGTWGPVIELSSPGGSFQGVSCTSVADCTAVGGSGYPPGIYDPAPIVATESDGTWGPVMVLSAPLSYGRFTSVSCSDAMDCTAVGGSQGAGPGAAFYATESSGSWGQVSSLPGGGDDGLASVSCSSPSDCAAVGADINHPIHVSETAGRWGTPTEVGGSNPAGFGGVSCPATMECTAVGGADFHPYPARGPVSSPMIVTQVHGTWSSPTELPAPPPYASLNAVSCPSVTSCTAVGQRDLNSPPIYSTAPTGPDAPRIGGVHPENEQVSVGFFPSFDGGSPITDFRVLASTGGAYSLAMTSPAVCRTSPCTVVGLVNGKGYQFEVKGVNTLGVSLPSSPSAWVAPATVPWAPRNLIVTPGNESVSVRWASPLHDGGSPVSYYLARAFTGGATYSCESTGNSCVIRGLTNGRRYAVRVFADNSAGLSAGSLSKQVIPQR